MALTQRNLLVIASLTLVALGVAGRMTVGADAAITSYLRVYPIEEDRFMNYDFMNYKEGDHPKDWWAPKNGSQAEINRSRTHVDWAVSMIFKNANKLKLQTAYCYWGGVCGSGSDAWGALNDKASLGWKTQATGGIKGGRVLVGKTYHMRLYADGDTPSMYNDRWGFYVVGTTHRDINEGAPWQWFGESEEAEEQFAKWAEEMFDKDHVDPDNVLQDKIRMYNQQGWPTERIEGDHHWHNSGEATVVDVPEWVKSLPAAGASASSDDDSPPPPPPPPAPRWYLRNSNSAGYSDLWFDYGVAGAKFVTGDWNNDAVDTPGIFLDGGWYLRNSNTTGIEDVPFFKYGQAGDIPVVGDWNGDGVDTIGVFRGTVGVGGEWFLRNSNSYGEPDYYFKYGNPNDIPVVGDWNGDGKDTIGVFRSGVSGEWFLRNSNSYGEADYYFKYGNPDDKPVTGNWDHVGGDSIGVYKKSTGYWYLRNSNSYGESDAWFPYGNIGDTPITGDWNADGFTTPGVVR